MAFRKYVMTAIRKTSTARLEVPRHTTTPPSISIAALNSEIMSQLMTRNTSSSQQTDGENDNDVEKDYNVGQLLGQGSFASVWEVTCKKSGEKFACKSLDKRENPMWAQEVRMCRKVQEERPTSKVMKVRDVYESSDEAFIISDYCEGGDLLDWMMDLDEETRKKYLTEKHAVRLALNMLDAAESCHKAGLAHLDLKPENFCFREKDPLSEIVLVDFGSAEPFERAPYAQSTGSYDKDLDDEVNLKRLIGTAKYMSPEVWEGRFSSRSDVWSVGVILYALLSNQLPFSIKEENDLFSGPRTKVNPFLEEQMRKDAWAHVSEECKSIVMNMLNPDAGVRPSTTECISALESL